jgi:hypothetical protein
MFNILGHPGNADQNDTEISSHPSQNSYLSSRNHTTTNIGENMGK